MARELEVFPSRIQIARESVAFYSKVVDPPCGKRARVTPKNASKPIELLAMELPKLKHLTTRSTSPLGVTRITALLPAQALTLYQARPLPVERVCERRHFARLRLSRPVFASPSLLRSFRAMRLHCLDLQRSAGPFRRSTMHTLSQEPLAATERVFIDQVIARLSDRPGSLLGILEAVQEHNPHKYLPMETLEYVAGKTETPLSRIYSVATFYALFNLEPQGDNTICICRGTACHTRGSRNLLQSARLELGIGSLDSGEESEADKILQTTPDSKFTVRTVACFGQCALAPVVEVNHRICGHVNERTLQREIRTIERESE